MDSVMLLEEALKEKKKKEAKGAPNTEKSNAAENPL